MIRHLVFWKLAVEDAEERSRAVAAMQERFAALVPVIDGTERIDIRADLGDTPGNWDVLLDADYRDADALEAYQVHPAHVEVAAFVRTLVTARACIDFAV